MNFKIKSDRLVLRPVSPEDVTDIYPQVTNPEISRYMSWEPHKNIDQTHKFVERLVEEMKKDKTYTWSIFEKERFCGIVSLLAIKRTHRALTYNCAELAYWVSKEQQGKGIMTEACNLVMAFAFEKLKLHRLVVSHASAKKASKALIEKLGFHFIGIEHQAFKKNGKWLDHYLYELLEPAANPPLRRKND